VHRDPRHRTITVTYIGFTSGEIPVLLAGDDAGEAALFPVEELPTLAFDHAEILRKAMEKLQKVLNKIKETSFYILTYKLFGKLL
jgi:8-oxo-dGTP diphosphatase